MSTRFEIDRFLNIKSASGPTWSPDGRRIAFASNITGLTQIWSVDREGGWPHQITFFQDRVMAAKFSPTRDQLLLHKDVGGNERAQMFLVAGDGSTITPLAHDENAINVGVWSRDGEKIAFSSTRRNGASFDIYLIDADGESEPRVILEYDAANYVRSFSPDGRTLLFARHLVSRANGLHLIDLESGAVRSLTERDDEALHTYAEWTHDGSGLFVATDRGRDFLGLAHIDVATGALSWLFTPDWDVDELSLSPDGERLAFTVNAGGESHLFLRHVRTGEQRQVDVAQGVISDLSWSPDSQRLAFSLDSSTRPLNVWVYDLSTDTLRQLTFAPQGGIPTETFVGCREHRYRSFDGLEIPGWLYLPHGAQKGDALPVIVYVHGGPEAQSLASFNAIHQYFLHRGYAIFAPNVRGSTGYGKAYTHLDDVRKRMDSVADLAACVPYLIETGYVDPKKIVVMGGSYGGFMTLAALTHYPDLWAAGVNIVGIANFETFLENTGAYRRKLRESEYGSLEHDREFFREISPIWHVDKIKAPLFVIHGANDPRVPVGEARQIVDAIKARGGIVEYLEFDDEGHGLVKLPNRIKAYPAVAAFLDRYVAAKEA